MLRKHGIVCFMWPPQKQNCLLYVVTASVELCVLCVVSISVKKCNVISAGEELCA